MTSDHKRQKDLVFCGCSLERYKKVPEYIACTHAWVLNTEAIYTWSSFVSVCCRCTRVCVSVVVVRFD